MTSYTNMSTFASALQGLSVSGKVVSTLITWNISFSPPIEFHLGNEQLLMPAPVQLEKLFVI